MADEKTQRDPEATLDGAAPDAQVAADEPAQAKQGDAKDGEGLYKGKPAEYWYSQATKAFAARDSAREAAGTVSESERAELEALRKAKEDAEEKRRIEAGDFEAAKAKYQKQVEDAEKRVVEANARYAMKAKDNAFRGAADLFGPQGYTTLPADFAAARFGDYVEFVPAKGDAPEGIQVRGLNREILVDEHGNPLPFNEGMRKLIDSWPDREHILRSNQRAGSGSTGGTGEAIASLSRAELADRAARGDKAALAAFRAKKPAGNVTQGLYWEQQARERDAQVKTP